MFKPRAMIKAADGQPKDGIAELEVNASRHAHRRLHFARALERQEVGLVEGRDGRELVGLVAPVRAGEIDVVRLAIVAAQDDELIAIVVVRNRTGDGDQFAGGKRRIVFCHSHQLRWFNTQATQAKDLMQRAIPAAIGHRNGERDMQFDLTADAVVITRDRRVAAPCASYPRDKQKRSLRISDTESQPTRVMRLFPSCGQHFGGGIHLLVGDQRELAEGIAGAQAGDLSMEPCVFQTEDGPYDAECGTLVVAEVADRIKTEASRRPGGPSRGLGSINEARSELPAITHVDGTGRLQTVNQKTNPKYYRLIETFGQATGIPVVLNTSFNLRGEPIVNTPAEAYSTFQRSGMDVLVLGDYIIEKS